MVKKIRLAVPALLLCVCLLVGGCSRQSFYSPDEAKDAFIKLTDEIFNDSVTGSGLNLHYLLADPQAYGITEFPATLGEYSSAGNKAAYEELEQLKGRLAEIRPEDLPESMQADYAILKAYIDTELSGRDFYLYDRPLSTTIGLQVELPVLLAEYAFYRQEDVDQYLDLLGDIDEFYAQVLSYVQEQAEAGICLSDPALEEIIESCRGYLDSPEEGLLAETFALRLEGLPNLDAQAKESYIARNRELLEKDFTRAYELLIEGLEPLKGKQVQPFGVCNLPNGKAYYEYLLRSSTYTSYSSPEALKDAILRRLEADQQEMFSLVMGDPELLQQLPLASFSITDPGQSLEDLKEKISADFPQAPQVQYEVREVPQALQAFSSPAFYLIPPIDQYDQNVIYINPAGTEPTLLYPTVAHEGYPGHLYQTTYFRAKNDSKLRSILDFSCYSEGWATYVEYYSYQLDDRLPEDLARLMVLNTSSSLGLFALMDYYINYEGWSKEAAADYLLTEYAVEDAELLDFLYLAVTDNPANYMKYYVGYLEISEMRAEAQEALGEGFDLKAFHTFLLDFGPAPFPEK